MFNRLKPKSEFSRNVLTLMTGTTIAQAIPIAISPILTRIYTPEDFGLFALYMSVASIVSVIATGRYELAIMLPKKDEDAVNIVVLSIMISFSVSFIALLIIYIFNAQISNLLGNQDISNWLYFVPVTVLFTGVYQSFNYWANRKKQYKRLATIRVVQSGTGSSLNLSFGFLGFAGGGLITSGLIGHSIAALLLVKATYREDSRLLVHVNKLKVMALLKKYRKLPLLNLPNSLIDIFKISGISILIAKFFTTATLGQYSLAWRMVMVPAALVGGSLSQVFFQKLASTKKFELNALIKRFIIRTSLIAAPFFLGIYLFSVEIFIFAFGEKWALAGQAASALTPWLFLNFVTSPLSTVYVVLNKQEVMLVFACIYMLIPLGIIYMLRDQEFIHMLSVMALSMSVVLVVFIVLILLITSKVTKEN